MESLDKKIKSMFITSIVFSIIYIAIGIFLILKPEDGLTIVSYILGIIFLIWGLVSMTKFFSKKESESYLEFGFILGAFVFIFGIIILIKPTIVSTIIPLLFGIWILLNGVTKLSYAITIFRENRSFVSIIFSLVLIVLGILLVLNPFNELDFLIQIVGSFLIAYSVLDIIDCFIIKITLNTVKKKIEDSEGKVVEAEYREK